MSHQNGMGVVPCWGTGPSMDLRNMEGEAKNILTIGTGEFGHILKTAGESRLRSGDPDSEPVHAYVLEKHPETLARHCILLACSLDLCLGLRERTELFLEIYGNAFLSTKGLDYVKQKAAQVARVLSGHAEEQDEGVQAALDWSHLKHKDLDDVLDVLLQWKAGTTLDMEKHWDNRLRRYYNDRYDHRKNASDWDYHMKLRKLKLNNNVETNTEIVGQREFMKWRLQGVAFEFRDTSYTVPNITMGTWVEGRRKGTSVLARGYWSDIINSPYLAFGLDADNTKLFKVANREQVYTSCDVSEYNVTQLLHALHTAAKIQPRVAQSGMGSYGDTGATDEERAAMSATTVTSTVPPLQMSLLLGEMNRGEMPKVLDRAKYHNIFDSVMISSLTASHANETLNKLLNTQAGHPTVMVETAKFALDFKPEHKTEFVRRVYDEARKAGWNYHGARFDSGVGRREAPSSGEAEACLTFVNGGEGEEGVVVVPELPCPEGVKEREEEKAALEEKRQRNHDLAVQNAPSRFNRSLQKEPEMLKVKAAKGDAVNSVTGVEIAVVQRNPDRVTRRPRELLVKVRLPGLSSAAGVDVDVDGAAKTVRVDHLGANLHAETVLPFSVDDEKGSATFDTDTSLLVLTLPVVAPTVEEKDALAHLEGEEPVAEGAEEAGSKDEGKQDHPLLKAQQLRGMAIPSKLGASIMF